jgi:DNA invertase Pin-like site-specific DNA recombinase
VVSLKEGQMPAKKRIATPKMQRPITRPTAEQVAKRIEEMRVLIAKGYSMSDLARHYSISKVSVAKFLRRYDLQTQQQIAYSERMKDRV